MIIEKPGFETQIRTGEAKWFLLRLIVWCDQNSNLVTCMNKEPTLHTLDIDIINTELYTIYEIVFFIIMINRRELILDPEIHFIVALHCT